MTTNETIRLTVFGMRRGQQGCCPEAGELVPAPGTVILLGVTGKKRLPLSPEARKIVAMLSTANIPFRMFSADNPALNWSALDQVGSPVAGAGDSDSIEVAFQDGYENVPIGSHER